MLVYFWYTFWYTFAFGYKVEKKKINNLFKIKQFKNA